MENPRNPSAMLNKPLNLRLSLSACAGQGERNHFLRPSAASGRSRVGLK
jgi:hypothetical protein